MYRVTGRCVHWDADANTDPCAYACTYSVSDTNPSKLCNIPKDEEKAAVPRSISQLLGLATLWYPSVDGRRLTEHCVLEKSLTSPGD